VRCTGCSVSPLRVTFVAFIPNNPASRRWNAVSWQAKLTFLIMVISIAGLIASEIWLTVILFVWALAGMLDAGLAGVIVLCVLTVPAALWATWQICVSAYQSELELI
jgi:hypothetical protein